MKDTQKQNKNSTQNVTHARDKADGRLPFAYII